jgi:hypothetical protein
VRRRVVRVAANARQSVLSTLGSLRQNCAQKYLTSVHPPGIRYVRGRGQSVLSTLGSLTHRLCSVHTARIRPFKAIIFIYQPGSRVRSIHDVVYKARAQIPIKPRVI